MALHERNPNRLPANPVALLKAVNSAEKKSNETFRLLLLVDVSLEPKLLAYAKEAFLPSTDNLSLCVMPYGNEPTVFAPGCDLVILLANQAPGTAYLLDKAHKQGLPAVAVTLDPARLLAIAQENNTPLDPASLVAVSGKGSDPSRLQRLFEELGIWIIHHIETGTVALARSLGFVRKPYVRNAIQVTSWENAAISAVFFLPGSDMPLLTINQVKLVLQIASAYDVALDLKRIREIVPVLLGAIGLRGAARKLVSFAPVLGWAIRGGVGYLGTLAIGTAAYAYFEAGAGSPEGFKVHHLVRRAKAVN